MIKTDERFDIRFMDASRLSCFGRCQAMFLFKCMMGLRHPDASMLPLNYGTIIHKVLPLMYGGDTSDAFELFDRLWAEFGYGEDDPKRNTPLSKQRIDAFTSNHSPSTCPYEIMHFDFTAPTELISKNEIPFLIDVGWDYPLCGRIDMPIKWKATGKIWSGEFKGQPLDALIMTSMGPRRMGDLGIGDYVLGLNGDASRVDGVYPLGDRDVYKVSFSDHSFVEVTEDHLWTVCYRSTDEEVRTKTIETKDVMRFLKKQEENTRARYYWLPQQKASKFCYQPIPIEPYVLGALLGDGSFHGSINFYNTDCAIIDEIKKHYKTTEYIDPRTNVTTLRLIGQTALIRSMGLEGRRSRDKFIPQEYLYNLKPIRLRILQGLMDTDGTVNSNGTPVYTTTSSRLAAGVKLLVESLGGICSITSHIASCNNKDCGLAFHCVFRLPDEYDAFLLKRKRSKIIKENKQRFARRFVSVEKVGSKQCQCIKVDAEDGLYLTEDFIPTHNTSSEISPRYFESFWLSPSACAYTLALSQITDEKIEGMMIDVMRISKTNIESQVGFVYVPPRNLQVFIDEGRNAVQRINEANESGQWGQNHALCSSYSSFGFPCRRCEYWMLCDSIGWDDVARFYKRNKPFDPLEEE